VFVVYSALPRAPSDVLVTGVTATSIALSWNSEQPSASDPHHDPVLSYVVQYRPHGDFHRDADVTGAGGFHRDADVTGAGGFREIRDVIVGPSEYDVSGLAAFTEYQLRVVAVNSVGRSPPSRSVQATTAQLGILSAVYLFIV